MSAVVKDWVRLMSVFRTAAAREAWARIAPVMSPDQRACVERDGVNHQVLWEGLRNLEAADIIAQVRPGHWSVVVVNPRVYRFDRLPFATMQALIHEFETGFHQPLEKLPPLN